MAAIGVALVSITWHIKITLKMREISDQYIYNSREACLCGMQMYNHSIKSSLMRDVREEAARAFRNVAAVSIL